MKLNKKNKKSNKKLSAIVGIVILVASAVAGVFLVNNGTGLISRASPEFAPKDLVVTNITENSFSISWTTDQKTVGFLKYGDSAQSVKTIVNDDRDALTGESDTYNTHHVTIRGLEPETAYYFKVASGGKSQLYDNNGKPYEVKTAPVLGAPPPADSAYGEVMTSANTPADGAIVYVSMPGSGKLSTIVNDGQWALSLSTARKTSLKSYVEYDEQKTKYDILIKSSSTQQSQIVLTTGGDQPVPTITIGQNYDFSTQEVSVAPETEKEQEILESSGSESVKASTKSGFNLEPLGEVTEASEELTVLNPSTDDEALNTTQPEFMGTGPAGTTITIEVHSDNEYTGEVVVADNNTWSWEPPAGLDPGDHTLTVSYTDGNGILQSLTRSFVVYAADESSDPSFTATPSATPKPTPLPTTIPTPTPTPVTRVSIPATTSGMPESGAVENTLILLTLGFGFMSVGGYLMRRLD